MPEIIFHIDDVGATHGSNVAMEVLWGTGLITTGSMIVPSGWFPETADLAQRRPQLDLGVHLTLTSESSRFRWAPLTTTSPASGLVDDDGYFWPDVPSVRRHAVPAAAAEELASQIERAQTAGIEVTHLDHHMGATLVPELVKVTAEIAQRYRLPILFPVDMAGYVGNVELGDTASDLTPPHLEHMADLRHQLGDLAFADRFVIGLRHLDRPAADVYRDLLAAPAPGTTFVSLHCNAPGDVRVVHPGDAQFRVEEFELFGDPSFVQWVVDQGWEPRGFRA